MPTGTRQASRAAVVGACGFLGSALRAALRRAGVPVLGFTSHHPCLSSDGLLAPGLAEADTVFWAASTVNPATAERQPAHVGADHDTFSSVLRALAEHPTGRRVVLLSSGGTVYDPSEPPPYDEATATGPRGAYGRSKLAMEEALRDAPAALGTRVAVRLSNVYGPGQPVGVGHGVVAHWLAAAWAGRPLEVLGDPDTTRDFIYLDDAVAALLAVHAHDHDDVPALFNVGAGRPTTLAELAALLLEIVGDPRLTVAYSPARPFDVSRTWLDTSLARRVLGWSPQVSLRAGLTRTWRARPAEGCQ